MRTYTLKKQPGLPLYESLYRAIREDILTGALQPGEKLPSKRALASNLEVGETTVEGAYNQLLEEGYISSRERSGYFVEAVEQRQAPRHHAQQRRLAQGETLLRARSRIIEQIYAGQQHAPAA